MYTAYAPSAKSSPKMAFFKRSKTSSDGLRPNDIPSRSVSPVGSFYGDGLRPFDLPPRGASPSSFYSHSSASTPSINSVSSFGSRDRPLPTLPPLTIGTSWLSRSPRSNHSLNTMSQTVSDLASPPETPVEVSEAELRRRQLEKATRILGEVVPLELVFHARHPFTKAFPDPPPRRSVESPQPRETPVETPTERRKLKVARRASLSLSTFTSKFRTGATNHSRQSSQESSSASSSDHSHYSRRPQSPASPPSGYRTLSRRASLALASPLVFAFPGMRSPSRNAPTLTISPPKTPDGLVIDIRSPESSDPGHDDPDATPVREHPRSPIRSHGYSHSDPQPRQVPMPAYTPAHTPSFAVSDPYSRSATPFQDPYTRPQTPFTDLAPLDAEPEQSAKHLTAGVSRKERGQGWSGEWNQHDMQDVIQKLRSLK
ncbi:hypothetical protein C8J57DRAFT_1277519 [Mycena rebaudengoi]|nr:hypothetical protein C8J57DRAFT_1277519 [Mycena rebaudengoi]